MAYLRPSLVLTLLLTLIVGLGYPLLTTGLAQLLFADQANGSLVYQQSRSIGSALIGQQFSQPGYFWGRPSATAEMPYNSLASGGSNLAISNPAQSQALQQRVSALRQAHGDAEPIPVDLLTASGSGLDPHISPAAAQYQAERVAKARGLSSAQIAQLIAQHTQWATPNFIGEPAVNVLQLNLALDDADKTVSP